ncbi:MAG TPA: SrtB family sortase [Lachnospiraceae bacterium]|nr:SrtB family sortase [Lachnospiraceae bacterium]
MRLEKKQILSLLLIIAFGAAVSFVGFRAGNTDSIGNEENLEVSEDMTEALDLSRPSPENGEESREESGGAEADFDRLKEQNPDIYAWITVPGTVIDYPVLQKGDAKDPYDNYYLDHQADLSEGFPGVIYSQPVNRRDFTDSVTVLYGHNLKSGEMFSSLHFFSDKDFFAENSRVIIDTPEKTLTYEIFAAVDFSDALLPYEYDFTKNSEVQRHLADVRKCEGNFREETKLAEGDKILVLSTCYSDKAERRLLVEAVLTAQQPK